MYLSCLNYVLRAHCIKVFDYNGNFLRQIGGEGITNYPIGVGINSNNEILVADNHNNFNLTVFSQDGKLINALESKVKHAQCFDVGLMDDGSIVLASKDYRIYVYKYSFNFDNSLTLSSPTTNSNGVGSSSMGQSSYQSGSASTLPLPHPMMSPPSSTLNGFNPSSSNIPSIMYPSSSFSAFPAQNEKNALSMLNNKTKINDNDNNSLFSNGNGLYSYFKSASIADNVLGDAKGLCDNNLLASAFDNLIGQPSLCFNSNDANHLQVDSANVNDVSQNESVSLLNLSTNTTTTNNINSMLNSIINI
jgi:hypothetical protein